MQENESAPLGAAGKHTNSTYWVPFRVNSLSSLGRGRVRCQCRPWHRALQVQRRTVPPSLSRAAQSAPPGRWSAASSSSPLLTASGSCSFPSSSPLARSLQITQPRPGGAESCTLSNSSSLGAAKESSLVSHSRLIPDSCRPPSFIPAAAGTRLRPWRWLMAEPPTPCCWR